MAEEYLDFIPLYPDQDEAAIRARWDAWANEGITVDQVDEWTDTREGSFFHMVTQPGVRESARIYDLMGSEVVAASNPLWAWESYLDDHAAVQNVTRDAATYAEGVVRFTGPNGTPIASGFTVGVEPATPDEEDPPEYETTTGGVIAGGILDLPVRATVAGSKANVGALAVTHPVTPLPDGVTFSNPAPIVGGTETETDPPLRVKLLDRYVGQGAGNRFDYERWALEEPGVGRVAVIALWNGPGTVKVIPMTEEGGPVAASVVTSLQNRLDPVAGMGEGQAPIGAIVTVQTAAVMNVDVTATVEFETGYSLDGFGGTIAVGSLILAAIERYVEGVGPGGEIVRGKILAAILNVIGVHDAAVTVPAANVPVPSDPPQVPSLNPPTITAGSL